MSINWHPNISPRPYQSDALEWALRQRQSVCCLPTGTGKTLVGVLWLKSLFESNSISHAVIIEPTRLLVEQVTEYLLEKAGVSAVPIDGRIPRHQRTALWRLPVVVCTGATAFNDMEQLQAQAVVVDECHHTVGQHAFARLMENRNFLYRLGLSATVPEKRRFQVEALIGRVRSWNWSDPEIQPFVPNWIGEVYESDLGEEEKNVLSDIRKLSGSPGLGPGTLERYLTRDGSSALRETLGKRNKLVQAFGFLLPTIPDRLHKLEVLEEVFDSHDFEKAIVFVDRVSIARQIAGWFPELNPVLFVGKGNINQKAALEQARQSTSRLIVATSAGEEGIDLPSVDLLVIWGNAASDIRFIQRLGRMMRKTGEGLKFATFIVTPESNDFDSFALGLAKAAYNGDIEVDKAFGWDPEVLWPRTTWWHVSELLRAKPTALDALENQLEVRGGLADKIINHATKRGRVFYIYDVAQISTDILRYYLEWDTHRDELAPVHDVMLSLNRRFKGVPDPVGLARSIAAVLADIPDNTMREALRELIHRRIRKFSVRAMTDPGEQAKRRRIYMMVEDASNVKNLLPSLVSNEASPESWYASNVTPIRKNPRGGLSKSVLEGTYFRGKKVVDSIEHLDLEIKRMWDDECLGYMLGFRSVALEYYFYPVKREVLKATIMNMEQFLLYRDVFDVALQSCYRCGGQGAASSETTLKMACHNCWDVESDGKGLPRDLLMFGPPLH